MADISQIPLPQQTNPFQGLPEYWNTLQRQAVADQLNRQKMDFANRQLAETSKYHEGELGIQRMAEDRAQRLMPYLLQKYKDVHNKAASDAEIEKIQNELYVNGYNQFKKQQAMESGVNPPSLTEPPKMGFSQSPQNMTALQNIAASGRASPQEMQMINQFLGVKPQSPLSVVSPTGSAMAPNNVPPEMMASVMGQSPRQAGMAPLPPAPQMTAPPQLAQPIAPNAAPSGAPMPPQNKEIVIQQGNPSLYWMDKMAGINKNVPAPQTHFGKDGMVYTRYPSGKMVAVNAGMGGQTPEEARQEKVKTAVEIEQGKQGVLEGNKLKKEAESLVSMANKAIGLKDLLDKNPDLTGWGGGLASTSNLSESPERGQFEEKSRGLQAAMARHGSAQGGSRALKWAEKAKPGMFKQVQFNKGMINANLDDALNDYMTIKQEYKDSTGKELPLKFPTQRGKVWVKKPEGDFILLTKSGADKLIKDHPDHEIVE